MEYVTRDESLLSLGARIEMHELCAGFSRTWSLLSLGARIEIYGNYWTGKHKRSRSFHWERGLKLNLKNGGKPLMSSLLSLGARIEIVPEA